MPKYVIERTIAGVGAQSRDELHAASARSAAVLERLGPDIQWVHSYVTPDKIYCIYIAVNEQMLREHADGAGLPADRISEVRAMIDPTMAAAATAAVA